MMGSSYRRILALCLVGAVLSAGGASSATGATPARWSWRATGTLGRTAECSKAGVRTAIDICRYRIPNAPKAAGTLTEVVRVKNLSSRTTCYGLSLATSYMAGLQSFCVKPVTTGEYRTSGLARHFDDADLSIFVTSGSKTAPIQAVRDLHLSPFTITFSEPLS
jgi:hypothetical protein